MGPSPKKDTGKDHTMNATYERMNSRRRTARFATCIMTFAASTIAAHAQTPPYVLFQNSTLTGSGNTINATFLPVVLSTGTIYENVTIQFDVDSQGNLTIAPGFPQVVKSPIFLTSKFMPGEYVGPSTILGGKALITVSGPSVAPGGTTEWTITTPTGADPCTYPSSATWYVGPLTSNPLWLPRLKKDGITSTAYDYGTGSSQCDTQGLYWDSPSTLLGFSQVGDSLTIYSYTNDGSDSNSPLAQITYCLVGSPNCPATQ
jgi:hypothetical protein